jgi:hypothetical protein
LELRLPVRFREVRLRVLVRAEAQAEALRAMRRARGFASDTMVEAFLVSGRTTRLASAATTPRVEPIFLATPVNNVDSCFVAILRGSLFASSLLLGRVLIHTNPHIWRGEPARI